MAARALARPAQEVREHLGRRACARRNRQGGEPARGQEAPEHGRGAHRRQEDNRAEVPGGAHGHRVRANGEEVLPHGAFRPESRAQAHQRGSRGSQVPQGGEQAHREGRKDRNHVPRRKELPRRQAHQDRRHVRVLGPGVQAGGAHRTRARRGLPRGRGQAQGGEGEARKDNREARLARL